MYTQEQLKLVSSLIKKLAKLGHPDKERVALEIATEYGFDTAQADDAIERISEGEPWEYIRGYTVFRGQKFVVDSNVLIPRIETEQLVEIALDIEKKNEVGMVIDVGTGSGAIICSIAKELPNDASFLAIDISRNALNIARANAKSLELPGIIFKQASLLEGVRLDKPALMIANLPYISTDEYKGLPDSVKDFEPKVALEGGTTGSELIEKFLLQAAEQRENIVAIALEMEPDVIERVKEIAKKLFTDLRISVVKDFREKDRFIVIER